MLYYSVLMPTCLHSDGPAAVVAYILKICYILQNSTSRHIHQVKSDKMLYLIFLGQGQTHHISVAMMTTGIKPTSLAIWIMPLLMIDFGCDVILWRSLQLFSPTNSCVHVYIAGPPLIILKCDSSTDAANIQWLIFMLWLPASLQMPYLCPLGPRTLWHRHYIHLHTADMMQAPRFM